MNSFNNIGNDNLSPISSLRTSVGQSSSSPTSSINWQTILIIILLLALLGFNIFAFLAQGTSWAADFTQTYIMPFLKLFGYQTLETTKQIIETSGTGSKAGIDIVTDTAVNIVDTIQDGPQTYAVRKNTQQLDNSDNDVIEKALHNEINIQRQAAMNEEIQGVTSGSAGYCYIGEENGNRTCSQVGINDTCMSGDIYPTLDVCVNPNLRA